MVKAIRCMYSVVVFNAAFIVLMTIGCMLVGILKHFGVDDAITYTWYGGILGFGVAKCQRCMTGSGSRSMPR